MTRVYLSKCSPSIFGILPSRDSILTRLCEIGLILYPASCEEAGSWNAVTLLMRHGQEHPRGYPYLAASFGQILSKSDSLGL